MSGPLLGAGAVSAAVKDLLGDGVFSMRGNLGGVSSSESVRHTSPSASSSVGEVVAVPGLACAVGQRCLRRCRRTLVPLCASSAEAENAMHNGLHHDCGKAGGGWAARTGRPVRLGNLSRTMGGSVGSGGDAPAVVAGSQEGCSQAVARPAAVQEESSLVVRVADRLDAKTALSRVELQVGRADGGANLAEVGAVIRPERQGRVDPRGCLRRDRRVVGHRANAHEARMVAYKRIDLVVISLKDEGMLGVADSDLVLVSETNTDQSGKRDVENYKERRDCL
ncbi:hypothetical protein ACSSS7_007502 [Eimeria intestinalis]